MRDKTKRHSEGVATEATRPKNLKVDPLTTAQGDKVGKILHEVYTE